jgi:hypothetical protein
LTIGLKRSSLEAAAGDPAGGGIEGEGKGKDQFKVRDLLADTRCSQPVLDFLATTDVGRRDTGTFGHRQS